MFHQIHLFQYKIKCPARKHVFVHLAGQKLYYLTSPHALVNEAFSISLFSSALGVNKMRLAVMKEESTSSSFAAPFDENESFTRPKPVQERASFS